MPGIEVICPTCHNRFTVAEDKAGLSVVCPHCDRMVAVPTPESSEQKPKLSVRRGTPIASTKTCPMCNAPMAEDALICIRCGFDTRTGAVFRPRSNLRKALQRAVILAVLAIVAVGVAIGVRIRLARSSSITPLPVAPPQPTTSEEAAKTPPSSEASTGECAAPTSPVSAGEPEPAQPQPAETVQLAVPSRAELEKQLTSVLDARFPLWSPGQNVVLRQQNGLVHRGELIVIGTTSLTVKTELGMKEIPFDLLDRDSRLRSDRDYRRKVVEARVAQMLNAQTNP